MCPEGREVEAPFQAPPVAERLRAVRLQVLPVAERPQAVRQRAGPEQPVLRALRPRQGEPPRREGEEAPLG